MIPERPTHRPDSDIEDTSVVPSVLPESKVTEEEERLDQKPQVEELDDNFYRDLYDDLAVSMVTVGPNISEYEAVEYEDISNETENQEYEEYETYEDGYGFAEREGADTWDGEASGRPLKGEKGEPAIFEPVGLSIQTEYCSWKSILSP
ncbi:unnamed protein product [Oncorhynchus mykiss]|uniref:Uncharacterized protein n=1 Tax=Oncorhynchus mykiss TaxID=8022 RepID=A0A060Y363_ONCMY|nr:unnamed protein product [Oncorhynchus mykiss]